MYFFTPNIFPDTQKYSLHVECLAGQENGPIHTHQENIPGISTGSEGLTKPKCLICKLCLSVSNILLRHSSYK